MVYLNGDEAIVFDTPINDKASAELIHWIGEKKIKAVVVTHFHIDCLGGLNAFHSTGIPSYAAHQTIALAKGNGTETVPKNGFDKHFTFQIGDALVEAGYFGQGHTADNIVGYIPSEKVLFGGCLVKEVNASKGNLADANTAEWPKTIKRIQDKMPNITTVIPGHGKSGGIELLEYTIELFKEKDSLSVHP